MQNSFIDVIMKVDAGIFDYIINLTKIIVFQITDDLWPLLDELRPGAVHRNLSAIHIRVFRPETPVTDY